MNKLEPLSAGTLRITPFIDNSKRINTTHGLYSPRSKPVRSLYTTKIRTLKHDKEVSLCTTRFIADITKEENKVIGQKLHEYEAFIKERYLDYGK